MGGNSNEASTRRVRDRASGHVWCGDGECGRVVRAQPRAGARATDGVVYFRRGREHVVDRHGLRRVLPAAVAPPDRRELVVRRLDRGERAYGVVRGANGRARGRDRGVDGSLPRFQRADRHGQLRHANGHHCTDRPVVAQRNRGVVQPGESVVGSVDRHGWLRTEGLQRLPEQRAPQVRRRARDHNQRHGPRGLDVVLISGVGDRQRDQPVGTHGCEERVDSRLHRESGADCERGRGSVRADFGEPHVQWLGVARSRRHHQLVRVDVR